MPDHPRIVRALDTPRLNPLNVRHERTLMAAGRAEGLMLRVARTLADRRARTMCHTPGREPSFFRTDAFLSRVPSCASEAVSCGQVTGVPEINEQLLDCPYDEDAITDPDRCTD
jgi:hypothetical protein